MYLNVIYNHKIIREVLKMKKAAILITSIFLIAACQMTHETASVYDDVYYTPRGAANTDPGEITGQSAGVTYGSSTSVTQYRQTSVPENDQVDNRQYDEYKSSSVYEEPYPESTSDEYYYLESDDAGYSDYSYSSRIQRFHRGYTGFGYFDPYFSSYYYDPFYSDMTLYYGYGPQLSLGYGWGWPRSSLSFRYGWGSFYSSIWYNPWYYGYPYYGYGSYWSGYYHGFYDGYWAGNTYYPSDIYSGNHYYGPRNPRGSSIIGSTGSRGSRVSGDDDDTKSSYVIGRESRIDGGSGAPKSTGPVDQGRTSRVVSTQERTDGAATTESPDSRQERIARPAGEQGLQGVKTEPARVSREAAPQTEPSHTATRSGETRVDQTQRNEQAQQRYAKPQSSDDGNVYSRERRYARPQANDLERNRTAAPRTYTAPNTNRPRSSNEYTVPNSRNTRSVARPQQQTRPAPASTPNNTRQNYTAPSRSNNQFSTPSAPNRISRPAPSGTSTPRSTPSRTISAPQRSSGTVSTPSAPSRSSGSSSSGRSSGSSSSGSGSSGKRGR
jgi:hypothetical protein